MAASVRVRHAGPAPQDGFQDVPQNPGAPANGLPATETPSQAMVRKANEVFYVTGKRGRQIGFKQLKVLDRARFFEMVGSESSQNQMFLAIAIPAQMSVSVDTTMLGHPTSRRDLDARISLLDDDGIEAINEGIIQHFAPEGATGIEGEALKNE